MCFGNDSSNNNNNTTPERSQQDELILKCYQTFDVQTIPEGDALSISDFRRKCTQMEDDIRVHDNAEELQKILNTSLQIIEEHKSYAKKAAHFFLNLEPHQSRWLILLATLWISFAMLCIFIGIAIKVDCDNDCQRDERCRRLPGGETELQCTNKCSLNNWSKSLFGIFLLDALLGVVCVVILIITLAEQTGLCGTRCKHTETFKLPARIAIFIACGCCLLGSLFGTLKLSAESGGIGPAFLIAWKWQYCYAFGYVAYAIIWGAYLLDLAITDFAKTAADNELPESARYLGGIVGFASSLCPLIFFISVGINVDRHYQDKLNGFKLVAPLFAFFVLRMVSALIVPVSNCFHHKFDDEIQNIVKKAATMIFLYFLGILGFIFSALTVNEDDKSCDVEVTWKWIWALIPLVIFTLIMIIWAVLIMLLLIFDRDRGVKWYNKSTLQIVDLLRNHQLAKINPVNATPSNSAPHFQNNDTERKQSPRSQRQSQNKADSFSHCTPLIVKDSASSLSQPNSQNQLAYKSADGEQL